MDVFLRYECLKLSWVKMGIGTWFGKGMVVELGT